MQDSETLRRIRDAAYQVASRATQDGDGVNIRRIAGQHINALLDPFLLIDEIRSDDSADYIGGFPEHPHRGFQTLTYMIEGGFEHRDSMGNFGEVNDGGMQWMSAGQGVLHSEMPLAKEGRLHGYQFWINLPAANKMSAPDYRDIQGDEVPVTKQDGLVIRALLGKAKHGNDSLEGTLLLPHTEAFMLDVALEAGAKFVPTIPAGHQTQVLVVNGELVTEKDTFASGTLLHFSALEQDSTLLIESEQPVRLLFFGGKPIAEPIAQYGPFVMNTMEEVEKALRDFRDGTLTLSPK